MVKGMKKVMKNIKRIIAAFLCACICVSCVVFADGKQSEDAARKEAMRVILSELSIMQGDPDGNMRYEDSVSRGEFAKVAVMASAYKDYVVPQLKLTSFSDVKGDNWCAPYVWVGVKNSMFNGYPDGTFRPGENVLYEEAANVLLRILGYTADDIGPSWPYGPVALANNIGLDENADVYAGKPLTRLDVANLVYNMLKAVPKGSNQDYINALGYSITEDVLFSATYDQDTSIGIKNIYTSAGTYEAGSEFDKGAVGLRGDLVLKDGKTAVCLIPSGQKKVSYTVTDVAGAGLLLDGKLFNIDKNTTVYYGRQQYIYENLYSLSIDKGDKFSLIYTADGYIDYAMLEDNSKAYDIKELEMEKYVVYSAVGSDVILYKDSEYLTYSIPDSCDVYDGKTKLSYSQLKQSLEMGDCLYLAFDAKGELDYIKYEEGEFKGPVSASDTTWQNSFDVDINTVSVMRNGTKASKADITSKDILYYCSDLNLVLAYYKTVTGVYEKASPNRDMPTSITLSGKSYELEGIAAFNKLSSGGNLSLGDTVTVLLGKDGKVADVLSEGSEEVVYGYLISTGVGEFEDEDEEKYSSYYAKVVLSDGGISEYATGKAYKDFINKVVKVVISSNKALLTVYDSSGGISGSLKWDEKTIGNHSITDDIAILDVSTTDKNKTSSYKNVFAQRLDGVNLSESDILYASKNENGKIDKLILSDVASDGYSYGILSDVVTSNKMIRGYMIYNKSGTYQTDITGLGGMGVGKGAKITFDSKGSIERLSILNAVSNVTGITDTQVIGDSVHTISSDVEVYVRSGSLSEGYEYTYSSLSKAVGADKSRILNVYYDKADSKGGRVRVIVISE